MRNQKKTRRGLSVLISRIITFTMVLAIGSAAASPARPGDPTVELIPAVRAVRAEAAVRQSVQSIQSGEAALADKEYPALMKAEKTAADDSIWDKLRERLPEIDFSKIDTEAEKEKLREAVRTMDELGISPEKLAHRAWEFLTRKENKEKIEQAAKEIRDKVQDAAEDGSTSEVVKKVREETGKAAEKVTKEITEQTAEKVTEQVTEQTAEKVTKEITEQTAEKVTE